MGHFYASIQGNRGEATRVGTKESGLHGHIRGWNIGCQVTMTHRDGEDFCHISLTSGSNGNKSSIFIGTFRAEDLNKNFLSTMLKQHKIDFEDFKQICKIASNVDINEMEIQ